MARVGFVGAGSMGSPMVERLVAAGHEVSVFARRPPVREHLHKVGADVVDDIADACSGADVLLVCVYSDAQLAEVGQAAIQALPSGAVFASHVTGSTSTIVALAEACVDRGIAVVDAPISGDSESIRSMDLTTLLGGEPVAVNRVFAVVAAYSNPIIRTGPLGSALAIKLVNNMLFAANCQLVLAALGVGRQLDVSSSALLNALQHMSGGSRASESIHQTGGPDRFAELAGPYLVKDVGTCNSVADGSGIDLAMLLDVVRRGELPILVDTGHFSINHRGDPK